MSQLLLNDMPIHKYIPMEKLDLIHPNEVRILYYQSPSRFYVYLRSKINSHAQFQVELQRAMENYRSISPIPQYQLYQPVVAQDNHEIWHRATILNFNPNSTEINVYFVDVGQEENISITNIRPLPSEFIRQPAFAIPCRLYEIYPKYNNSEQYLWKLNDHVHDEFNRLMANNASCKVCDIKEQICYDVAIEIPHVGDLGTYLSEQNLVIRMNMRSTNQTLGGRIPPGFSDIQQQQQTTRVIQKPTVQQSPSTPTSMESSSSSSDISTLPPQDGNYTITQVYSAIEFYGHSQLREKELDAFHKHLEIIYNNNNTNDQSLSVHFLMDGVPCVIQQGEKYHRVIIKHRESESRVLVKLVDRGDEMVVDTSELLQLEKKYFTIPAFAQPFRLYNYDESHSTANITRKLKRLILNQRVHITQHLPMINGFYPVEVKLSDNQSVNQILLSNDIIPIMPTPIKPVEVLPPPPPPVVVQSTRTNEDLPAPQKLLTAPSTSRFTPTEQTSRFSRPQHQQEEEEEPKLVTNGGHQPLMPELNRPYGRGFSAERNGNNNNNNREVRNNEERDGQRSGGFNNNRGGGGFADRGNRNGFGDRNNEERDGQRSGGFNSNRGSGGFADRGGRNGFGGGDRNNEERDGQRSGGFDSNRGGGGFSDRGNRNGFGGGDRNNEERDSQRTQGFNSNRGSGGGGFADRGGRSGFGGGDRNNEERDGQRSGGFNSNRGGGGGFADRGNRSGFGGGDRNNEERDGQRSGGFNSNRGSGGFADRGNRNGFGGSDRNNEEHDGQRTQGFNSNRGTRNGESNRFQNNQDENGGQRFGNRGGERRDRNSGFQNHHDRGEDGGGFPRRGGFSDRGGSRGGRGGFSDRGNRGGGGGGGSRTTVDNDEPMKTFSGWPNVKPTRVPFESGDEFIENEIPKDSFEFVLSHIEKSNDFFIQLISKENELSKLNETLQIEYKDAPELDLSTIKLNQACLAKSSDKCWYRATLLTTDDLLKTNVRFIDFGDTINLEIRTIRQLAKKFCLISPYAYHCTFKNVEINEQITTDDIITKCANKKFHGKFEEKPIDNKYYLQSNDLKQLMIDINAIQKNLSCIIVYIDNDKHEFYIQDNFEIMDKIKDEIDIIDTNLPLEEIQLNTMVISTFEDIPYRAIIQSIFDDDIQVYFVDYGNTNICSKSSLKKCTEQLQTYSYQAKKCQLFNISINNINQALQELDQYTESDNITYSIMNQTNDLFNIQIYINDECFNEKFSNEQERPINSKRNNEEIFSPLSNNIENTKRQKNEVELKKFYEGTLTYIDKINSSVYIQLLPESEIILDEISKLINKIIEENQRNLTYNIGDYVIAKFIEDNNYYRGRIESYNESTNLYKIFFIDYGNTEDNISKDSLYSYSNELKQIPSQIHCYSLDNKTILNNLKLNEIIHFEFIDDNKSIINIKFDNDNQQQQGKTFHGNICGINDDYFYIHILPDTDTIICEIDELLQTHIKEHNELNNWNINDLCIVFNSEQNQYFRGKILFINNDKYDIQCIDYGNVLKNITNDHIYLLKNNDLIKQNPIAKQCRLHGVNEQDQIKAINDTIRNINPTERITITIDNDQNTQCMYVMLFRENHEIVNDLFIKQDIDHDSKTAMSTNSSDSAIAADGDDNDTTNEQQVTSPIGVPQAESTHQFGDATNLTINITNQTIDFGENDPSSSNTTLKDETEN